MPFEQKSSPASHGARGQLQEKARLADHRQADVEGQRAWDPYSLDPRQRLAARYPLPICFQPSCSVSTEGFFTVNMLSSEALPTKKRP